MGYNKIMYLGIDIGGTKTLAATLTNEGVITESVKFPTPKDDKNPRPVEAERSASLVES